MAKRVLGSKGSRSKITGRNKETSKKTSPVIVKTKTPIKPTSVRLIGDDKMILRRIVQEINELSNSTLSESDTIRALIRYGKKAKTVDIFQAYKDWL